MNYQIKSGRDQKRGTKLLIYGREGVGKTLLASHLPNPLWLDLEGSTGPYGFQRLDPTPKSWQDVLDAVFYIAQSKPCSTLVIDTFDKAEELEIRYLVENDPSIKAQEASVDPAQVNIATLYGGYGNGYVVSEQNIRSFLCQLEELVELGLNVCLICHSTTVKAKLPGESAEFDKYELKLGKGTSSKTSAALKEWADIMLFLNFETYVQEVSNGRGIRGVAKGGLIRKIYTTATAIYDAKNRHDLPEVMELTKDRLPDALVPIFGGKPETISVQKPVASLDPEPQPEVITPPTQNQPGPEPVAEPVAEDSTLWGCPFDVEQMIRNDGFSKENLQLMFYQLGMYPNDHIDMAKDIPESFWEGFKANYQTIYKPALTDIAPF